MKVAILLSTYNGEKYLCEQIDSLLAQKDADLDIYIRDDGSTDKTLSILSNYQVKNSNITLYSDGENVGPANSFFRLVNIVPPEYDCYFFCDQDDVWCPNKVVCAFRRLKEESIPSMYYCATELVDPTLAHIGINYRETKYTNNIYYSYLRGSLITGCTIAINNSLLTLLKQHTPTTVSMHDTWTHLLCLSVDGNIIGDRLPHIKYRQHDSNVLGLHKMSIMERYKLNFCYNDIYRQMATVILQKYQAQLSFKTYNFLNIFINYNKSFTDKFNFSYFIGKQKIDLCSKMYIILKILLGNY